MPTLPAALTHREATATLAALEPALGPNGAEGVTIDASALETFDSSAIAVLLECQRRVQAAGRRLEVFGAPTKLVELATLYGVADLLPTSAAAPPVKAAQLGA